MPKRTVHAYTVLLYIYMKQNAPIPASVFLYVDIYNSKDTNKKRRGGGGKRQGEGERGGGRGSGRGGCKNSI